jgi:uncharacterized protein (TIGR02246 family)
MATAIAADQLLAAYRDALERRDAHALLDVFADDAVLVSYSERNRPSSARRLEGRAAIEEEMNDVMARDMTHTIEDAVVGDDRFAGTERCVYASGEHVVSTFICHLRDGKIARQVGVEAWDE